MTGHFVYNSPMNIIFVQEPVSSCLLVELCCVKIHVAPSYVYEKNISSKMHYLSLITLVTNCITT